MSKTNKAVESQLAAGGMLPIGTKVDPKSTEKVVARTYGGAALGDRKVVRLGAERLGPAEDLAMEFLGLEPAGESKPIAIQSRRAMGFASWALITHPENAKDALVLVKRIKAAARKAKSKPGHAWDALTEMAEELNRSVRHFLPPFWEEAARIYKDLGNHSYAGRGLGKALEAERVHALDVDRTRRRDAVLEFALSGCLSGKALGEYTKDLEQQFEPAEAFETFRDLLVRRTLGGMPPMASAAKDLVRLAKLAGKDPDAETDALLTEIISSPAMARAPKLFWKSVSKRVSHLVQQSDSFGLWLLVHTNCDDDYYNNSPAWDWLDQLDRWKVLPLLAKPVAELPSDVQIPGGRAGWFSRLASAGVPPKKRFFELLESAAAALREEAQPLNLGTQRGYASKPADVDVLEACLDLGIPVAELPANAGIGFSGWLQTNPDHTRRNSSLKHVLDDQRFAGIVRESIPSLICGEQRGSRRYFRTHGADTQRFDKAATGHDAIKDIWWQFLDQQLSQLEKGGLADVEVALNVLRTAIGRATIQEFPVVMERLKKVSFAAALQRTLIAGVIDEYGWDALDQADDVQALVSIKKNQDETLIDESFPTITIARGGTIEVIGAQGSNVVGEFVFDKTKRAESVRQVQNDVLVGFRDVTTYASKICWLSDPDQIFPAEYNYWNRQMSAWMPLQDGVFFGTRLVKPGDSKIPEARVWFSDGDRFWNLNQNVFSPYTYLNFEDASTAPKLVEIDPVTGKKQRESIPPWFEDQLSSSDKIHWTHCRLMPAPATLDDSPLGIANGMVGWRVIGKRDGSVVGLGIDGRTCTLQPDPHGFTEPRLPVAMINRPATDSYWILTADGTVLDQDTGIALALLPGDKTRYCLGQPKALPVEFFHLFSLRCLTSSTKLRSTTAKQAAALLDAGDRQHQALRKKKEESETDPDRDAVSQAVAKWLPKAPERLAKGVSKLIAMTAAEQASLNAKIQRLSEPPKTDEQKNEGKQKPSFGPSAAGVSNLALSWFGDSRADIYRYGNNSAPSIHVEAVIQFLQTGTVDKLHKGQPDWISAVDDTCTAAWNWFWKQSTNGADVAENQDQPVHHRFEDSWGLKGLAYLAESGILDWDGKLVYYIAQPFSESDAALAKNKPYAPDREKPIAFVDGKNRYVAYPFGGYRVEQIHVLEYSPNGKPKPPKPYNIIDAVELQRTWNSKQVQTFVDAVRRLETLPLVDGELLAKAAEKLGASPVQVGLAWMSNLRTARYGQEKLTKELRGHYGWKVNEIKTAISGLDGEALPLSLLATGLRDDPDGAIGQRIDAAFERMIAAWQKRRQSSVALPPECAAQLEHIGGGYPQFDRKTFLSLLSDPVASRVFESRELTFGYVQNPDRHQQHALNLIQDPEPPTNLGSILPQLLDALGWVNYSLPFGDPARRQIPAVIESARQWIDDPVSKLEFGAPWTMRDWYGNKSIDTAAVVDQFSKLIAPCNQQKEGHYTFDGGLVLGALYPPICQLAFRTSKLHTTQELELLSAAARLTFNYEGDGADQVDFARFVLEMRSDIADQLIHSNSGDQLADGVWEQDPRCSVPDLVDEVSKKWKLDQSAATLYLQLLALPDPTNKNLQRWNHWKPAELKSAVATLAATDLVVTAKRSRAGRELFLPGGWEALKLPNLPVESWKLAQLGYQNTDRLRGGNAALLVCSRPLPNQFRLAWDRTQSGDAPRYEESLQT
ncbi:DNA-binding protein [Stieleria sp. TO1_6]|uniref:DNA-binding protein n=1 Tax=Stieleria tagensis TaxID=2956795 RepID=UPI00209B9B1B|nr:DNA-binding protein [Stieleria tagensis]MCO8121995.1 DNA-binding protein [Stieleria tagensis]